MITQRTLPRLAASLTPCLIVAFFLAGCLPPASGPAGDATETRGHTVPEKVETVLKHIDEHHAAPNGYEGGREFHNAGRNGEESLPRRDAHDRPITYQEWDVNPKVAGVNRGAERLVTGSDGSAYYTSDHYRTFTKIR
jgi:guanyl-specific ribonuclease Sa